MPHAWKIASIVRTLPHSRHGATLSCKCECPSAVLLLLREPLWIDALPDLALMSQRRCVFGTFRPVKTTPAPISDHKKLGRRQPACRHRALEKAAGHPSVDVTLAHKSYALLSMFMTLGNVSAICRWPSAPIRVQAGCRIARLASHVS